METFITLLILSSMKYDWTSQGGLKYNFTINVINRAYDYGGSVTILCKFEGCCSTFAAWEAWKRGSNDDFEPIFTDVTNLRMSNTSKYDGGIRPDGYTLIIRNLSRADLNMYYTCTYGSHRSDKKLLLKEDVFHKVTYSTQTTRKPNNKSGVHIDNRILGVSFLVLLLIIIVMLILWVWYKTRCRRNGRNIHKEPEHIDPQSMTSLICEQEKSHDQNHGEIMQDEFVIFCLCSSNNSDKKYTRDLKKRLVNYHGLKSVNIKSNVDFLPGQPYYYLPDDVSKLIIIISNEYEMDDHFSKFVEQIVNQSFTENKLAYIFPVLRSDSVITPRCLTNIAVFSGETDSFKNLVTGILQCKTLPGIIKCSLSLIDSRKIFSSRPQNITELNIKPDNLENFERLTIELLIDWGVNIDIDGRLSIDIVRIQEKSQNSQVCLGDIFANRMIYVKRINFVRLYGVEHCNIKQFKLPLHMKNQVKGVFRVIIRKLNEKKKWFYHYKRNSLMSTGSSEEAFRLMKQILQEEEPVTIFPQFKAYESRLKTFSGYPIEGKSFRENMAKAGFFYFNIADYVQCFTCGGCLCKWSNKHDPVLRHKAYFKSCNFSKRIHPQQVAESETQGLCSDTIKRYQGRLKSFIQFHRQFPAQKNITAKDIRRLAYAGFYYCGITEDIACYACGICYTTMQYSKQINHFHKKHSPFCPHLTRNIDHISDNPEQTYAEKAFEPYLELEYHEHELTYTGST
ncbi:uncharacterized protein LOC134718217 [Mytilus trossulus]|uniref:uncharacterized protein LOC134718217 n=1 Tax=Mytilus trossulus TaxID=6551 RepID=UPI003006189A